jgi:hypothetical protein
VLLPLGVEGEEGDVDAAGGLADSALSAVFLPENRVFTLGTGILTRGELVRKLGCVCVCLALSHSLKRQAKNNDLVIATVGW